MFLERKRFKASSCDLTETKGASIADRGNFKQIVVKSGPTLNIPLCGETAGFSPSSAQYFHAWKHQLLNAGVSSPTYECPRRGVSLLGCRPSRPSPKVQYPKWEKGVLGTEENKTVLRAKWFLPEARKCVFEDPYSEQFCYPEQHVNRCVMPNLCWSGSSV